MKIRLDYIEKGTGTPLILLHGNGESKEYFKHQINVFSKNYRVIAVDTRGHGKSPRGMAPFTLNQFAEDLKEFLDSLEINRAIILGFSDGANIALLFTLKYPDYTEKLILNGADLTPKGVRLKTQLPICLSYGIVSLISVFDKKAISKKEMLGLMVTQPNINPTELNKIKVPALVIVGTDDMIKQSHSRLIAESIPKCKFSVIEGDHFIAGKSYKKFNEEILKFLKE
jgi:pimeloyl-ACP methyl ester carboxylesterase